MRGFGIGIRSSLAVVNNSVHPLVIKISEREGGKELTILIAWNVFGETFLQNSKMQFNIVRRKTRGRVFQSVSATGGLIWLLVYPDSHS